MSDYDDMIYGPERDRQKAEKLKNEILAKSRAKKKSKLKIPIIVILKVNKHKSKNKRRSPIRKKKS